MRTRAIAKFTAGLSITLLATLVSGQSTQPFRWNAQYAPIYSDNVETVAPSLAPGLTLDAAGSLTSSPSEVIAGKGSIKGSYSGSATFTPYLHAESSILPLSPNHSYGVTFQYKILTAPSNGFEVLFYSPTGGAAGNFLPSVTVTGQAGATGQATLTNTLGPYSDYQARWTIGGTGAISIDNIQLMDLSTGKVLVTENAEATTPGLSTGLQLRNGARVVTDPAQVIAGNASVQLSNFASIETNPATVALGPNTTYIVEFQYRIISSGTDANIIGFSFQDAATRNPSLSVNFGSLLTNAATAGTVSAGAQTAGSASYVLTVGAGAGATVVIDNISIYRQSSVQLSSPPAAWSGLESLPYPRLGKNNLFSSSELAQSGPREGIPFLYTVAQIENRLSLYDIVAGIHAKTQTMEPDEIRRLRQLNPQLIVTPYRISEEEPAVVPAGASSTVDIDFAFHQGVADGWYARNSNSGYVTDPAFDIREMNISDNAPPANGQTFGSYLTGFLTGTVFPSGIWDGVFMDNLFGRVNPHIPNFNNPALFDIDYNRNGIRDETPASASEITRKYATQTLAQLRDQVSDLQIVMGNAGNLPERSLAPYVNGYVFECFNESWDAAQLPNPSEGGWRHYLDSVRVMQNSSRRPVVNLLEGCGRADQSPNPDRQYAAATARDIQRHRMALGSALLGDGFYGYDLYDLVSAPYWFDEYSVNASGTAVEDRSAKGYLGAALTGATELATAPAVVLQENFESGSLPSSMFTDSRTTSITRQPGEVISGSGSLVLNNPDHTKQANVTARTNPAQVPLSPGVYLISLDYRILETLDSRFLVGINDDTTSLGNYQADGVVAGDSGTIQFPVTIPSPGNWSVGLTLLEGGGKIAIDNFTVSRGGAGPWRRDFENGFVLVNPLNQPHTFSADELAGSLNRNGVRRIKGTQAPEVNSGQPVAGDLTLGAFDAIILLADHIGAPPLPVPNISLVANGFGDTALIAPNTWVEIKGSNLAPAGDTRIWQGADFITDHLPVQLDRVSVTVNGRTAYPYFISPTQVNILTPPDPLAGPVQVQLTNSGVASNLITVQAQPQSLSFFEFVSSSGRHYVYGRHLADNTIIGPATLFPGQTTPVKPGETIYVAGNGFGITDMPVVSGAVIQAGTLPKPWPLVQIAGVPATVLFAGLAAPGTYIFDITLPVNLPDGDLALTATYDGLSIQPNLLITVQH